MRDPDDELIVEPNQTIHAGLSSRSLSPADRDDLFGADGESGIARRHGTVWLIPLQELLAVRPAAVDRADEIGGGLQYNEVTAIRWRDPADLDVNKLLRTMVARLDKATTPAIFDFGQLVELAEFWIKRAYVVDNPNDLLPLVTLKLFDDMRNTLEVQAAMIIDETRKKLEPGDEPEVTTCARFLFDAFKEASAGIDVPLRPEIASEAPGGMSDVRRWITPNDILLSPSFRVVARWTRRPTPRVL
jgi:hypothetical protein